MLASELHNHYQIEDVYILQSGTFYFFEHFLISEFNEGVLVNYEMVQEIIELAYMHYGHEGKISYISNRINSYTLVPQDWLKFFAAKHRINCMATVTYKECTKRNTFLERLFFNSPISNFESLPDAAAWVLQNYPMQCRKLAK